MQKQKFLASHATAFSSRGQVPDHILVLPAGTFHGRDGRGPYTLADADAVIRATREHFGSTDIVLDYNHQTEFSSRNGQPAPAAGWLTDLSADAEGIWAHVKWTERGRQAVASREFRYISPVFWHDEEGSILMLASAALTNIPNLDLKALSERGATITPSEETSMDKEAIAQALGLPATASEEDILARAKAAHEAEGAVAAAGKALQAAEGPGELVAAAQAAAVKLAQAGTPDPAKYVPMAMHEAATKELAELKARQARAQSEGLVAEAEHQGKLTPAMHDWGLSYAARDPEGFKAWMAAAPNLTPGGGKESGTAAAAPEGGKAALNEYQKAVCAAMGMDEKKYAEEVQHGSAD